VYNVVIFFCILTDNEYLLNTVESFCNGVGCRDIPGLKAYNQKGPCEIPMFYTLIFLIGRYDVYFR